MRFDPGAASFRNDRLPCTGASLTNVHSIPRSGVEGQPAPYYLIGSPGLAAICRTGAAPCDGLVSWQGSLYGVFGPSLWKDVHTAAPSLVGGIGGTGPVTWGTDRAGLVIQRYNGPAPAVSTQMWDGSNIIPFTMPDATTGNSVAGPGAYSVLPTTEVASSCAEQDNFTIYSVVGSDKFYVSDPTNPTSIQGLNFATAEARPDNLVRVLNSKLMLLMLGTETVEIYYNAGATTGVPFLRYQNAFIEIGLLASDSAIAFHGRYYFLATDKKIYSGQDLNAAPVSPDWLNQLLATIPIATLAQAHGLAYTADGIDFYCLTIPGYGSFEFNSNNGTFTNRKSPGLTEWRGKCAASINGLYYIGDSVDGTVWQLVPQFWLEGTNLIEREVITPPFGGKEDATTLSYVDIDFNPSNVDPDTAGAVLLAYSDDDGRTFSKDRVLNVPKLPVRRCIARALGRFRRRQLRIKFAGPAPFRIDNLYIGLGSGWPKGTYAPGTGGTPPPVPAQ